MTSKIRFDRSAQTHDASREQLMTLLEMAMGEIDPECLVARSVQRTTKTLSICGHDLRVGGRRTWILGIGKASVPMAAALEGVLGDTLAGGLVITRRGYGGPLRMLPVMEAGHPLPDTDGLRAAQRLERLSGKLGEQDIVFCLLSGGGSALLASPAAGLELDDLVRTTQLLLHSGAAIDEANVVRRHLSALQGGRLAAMLESAHLITLVLSDVVLGGVEAIASGPTVADPSTFQQGRRILEQYGLWSQVTLAVRSRIEGGCVGSISETIKPGDPVLDGNLLQVIGSNRTIVDAVCEQGTNLEYRIVRIPDPMTGEARDAGRALARMALDLQADGESKALIVGGGETTVTVSGGGVGGRNQEFALAAALELSGQQGIRVAALATDGTDGPTDAAGAIVDGQSINRAIRAGSDPHAALAENNVYPLLLASGDLLFSGPTRTNVADLYLAEIGTA